MLIKELNLEEASKAFNYIEKKAIIPSSFCPEIVSIDCENRDQGAIPKFIFFESGKDVMLYSFIFTPISIDYLRLITIYNLLMDMVVQLRQHPLRFLD